MSEGSDSTHLLMASLVGTKELVECKANLVSYFDTGFTYFWERSFYCCFEVHKLRLIYSSRDLRLQI
jgi:hypothetical protein